MRKIVFILLTFLFLYSCSDGNDLVKDDGDESGNGNNSSSVKISLKAKAQEANIHTMMEFYLVPGEDCTMLDIMESYDSLVWRIEGEKGRLNLLSHAPGWMSFTSRWGHCFYEENHGNVILEGFKDGKVVLSDSVRIEVYNKRDFLGYNWKDITSSTNHRTGIANILKSELEISFIERYIDGLPSLYVYFEPAWEVGRDEKLSENFYTQKQETLIRNYISKLYGDPKFSFEKDADKLVESYHKIFKQEEDAYTPRYVWETKTTNIALVSKYVDWGDYQAYYIYAEPRSN